MASNRCPVCGGIGKVLAFGFGGDPVPVQCPECAGLACPPASVDDFPSDGRTDRAGRDAGTVTDDA